MLRPKLTYRNGRLVRVEPRRPVTPAERQAALKSFVEERIAIVGGVTEDALKAAGFTADDVEEFGPAIREHLSQHRHAYA